MTAIHPLLGRAFAALDEANVRWALLRGEEAVAAPDGDVDLLIEAARLAQAEAALRTTGFVRIPTFGRASHRFHLGFAAEDERWIKLDVVTALDFGPGFEVRSRLGSGCLARAARQDGVMRLRADDAFWSLLLHALLDRPGPTPGQVERLRALADGVLPDSPWRTVVAALAPSGWDPDRLTAAALAGDLEALHDAGRGMRLRLGPSRLVASWLDGLRARVLGVLERIQSFLARPGLSVTLLGPDGSGKSSIAQAVAAHYPFPARVMYLGIWKRPPPPRPPRIPGSDLVRRLGFIWRRYLIGRLYRSLRRLVLFDRYTFDVLLGDRTLLGLKDRAYVAILAAACPPPDLVLVLDLPPEVAFARKGERTIPALQRDRTALLDMAARSASFRVVDASRPLAEVRREVLRQVWDAYVARWRD